MKKEIEDRFYRDLEFGTAGLRGVVEAGRNRMNIYTVRRTSYGLANYFLKNEEGAARYIDYNSNNCDINNWKDKN